MFEPHYYNVEVSWTRDRKGTLCSPEVKEGQLPKNGCINVATPPEFPKGIAGIWSPEHFFTAAVGSCLMTTFLSIAENSKLEFVSFYCMSRGKLEQIDGAFLMTEVILEPRVVIRSESQKERAQKVLQKAEQNCLISNSLKSRIEMRPVVEVELMAA